jgi:hypothetical protein
VQPETNCEQCRKYYEKIKKDKPDCSLCIPKVLPQNEEAARIFPYIMGQFKTTGMGDILGLDLVAVKIFMDWLKVDKGKQMKCFNLCNRAFMEIKHYLISKG